MTEWTTDSNEALRLSLVRSSADKEVLAEDETYEDFHPTFTYPIYGDDEKIYGYKDLDIDLRFASGSLATFLKVSSSATLPSSSTSSVIDDPYNALAKFLPEDIYKTEEAFQGRVESQADTFQPFGEKVFEYSRPTPGRGAVPPGEVGHDADEVGGGEGVTTYEVWHATWDTSGFREYHRRMQIFILLYIEAGSYINEDEDSWEFMVLYEKRKRRNSARTETYHFIGYSSLYPFYCFPERVRMRLSQFIILPPYQHKGHGSGLYQAIYHYVLSKPVISELTVEDPAEAFEDLRDRNDLKMLLSHEQFMREAFGKQGLGGSSGGGKVVRKKDLGGKKGKGKLEPPSDKMWMEKWRKDLKIAGRQFSRLVEMLILLHLDSTNPLAIKAYRLQVKERLYRFNFEVLVQLEEKEKHEKLEETYQSVVEDYRRILDMIR